MKFIIAVNEPEENGSVTFHQIDTGSDRAATNKKHLKSYLTKMGVGEKDHKTVLKKLGFWGSRLGK